MQCPCCHQEIEEVPPEFLADGPFSPSEQKIIQCLAKAWPRKVGTRTLIDCIYGDDPEGGPDNAEKCVYVFVSRLRKQLVQFGWQIPIPTQGRHSTGLYGLQKRPTNNG